MRHHKLSVLLFQHVCQIFKHCVPRQIKYFPTTWSSRTLTMLFLSIFFIIIIFFKKEDKPVVLDNDIQYTDDVQQLQPKMLNFNSRGQQFIMWVHVLWNPKKKSFASPAQFLTAANVIVAFPTHPWAFLEVLRVRLISHLSTPFLYSSTGWSSHCAPRSSLTSFETWRHSKRWAERKTYSSKPSQVPAEQKYTSLTSNWARSVLKRWHWWAEWIGSTWF